MFRTGRDVQEAAFPSRLGYEAAGTLPATVADTGLDATSRNRVPVNRVPVMRAQIRHRLRQIQCFIDTSGATNCWKCGDQIGIDRSTLNMP